MNLKRFYRLTEDINLSAQEAEALMKHIRDEGDADVTALNSAFKKLGGGSKASTTQPTKPNAPAGGAKPGRPARGTPPPASGAKPSSAQPSDPFGDLPLGPHSSVRKPATSLPMSMGGSGPDEEPGEGGSDFKSSDKMWDPRSKGIGSMLPAPKSANVTVGDDDDEGGGYKSPFNMSKIGLGGGSSWDASTPAWHRDDEMMPRPGGGSMRVPSGPKDEPASTPGKIGNSPFAQKKGKAIDTPGTTRGKQKDFDIDDVTGEKKPGLLGRLFGRKGKK